MFLSVPSWTMVNWRGGGLGVEEVIRAGILRDGGRVGVMACGEDGSPKLSFTETCLKVAAQICERFWKGLPIVCKKGALLIVCKKSRRYGESSVPKLSTSERQRTGALR